MSFLEDFMPFYPKKRRKPKYDIDQALNVEVYPHPSLETHRGAQDQLVLVTERQMHPAEEFIGRFFKIDRRRHIVLEEHGEFIFTEAVKPGTKLKDVVDKVIEKFSLAEEDAKQGVIHVIKELMIREFVFIVRTKSS